MKKVIVIVVGIIILLVVGNAVYAALNNRDGMQAELAENQQAEVITEVDMAKEEAPEDGQVAEVVPPVKDPATGAVTIQAGVYEEYAADKLVRAETGDVVLFFHASWCPSCRALNAEIEKDLTLIAPGVSILKVDYDKEQALKKKYGVTYQHTLVQVDKDGNLIKKWSGSPNLSSLQAELE